MSLGKPPHHRYREQLERECMMKPRTLTIVKGLLFSIIMGMVVSVSIIEDTGMITVIAFIIAVLLVFGVEINEIEVGNVLYVNFSEFGDNKEENDDDD